MKYVKKYYKFAILIIIMAILIFSPVRNYINIDKIMDLLQSVKNQPYAPYVYVLLYILGVLFAVPGFALTIIAGPMFGMWKGLVLVVIAANIGCQLTFFISRFFGYNFINRFVKQESLVDKLKNKIEENGFMVMLYIRLLPIFPFNIINYISGLTSIKHRDYTIATLIGMLPGSAVYVYLSASAINVKDNPLGLIVSIVVLIIFTIITTLIKKKQTIFKEDNIEMTQDGGIEVVEDD